MEAATLTPYLGVGACPGHYGNISGIHLHVDVICIVTTVLYIITCECATRYTCICTCTVEGLALGTVHHIEGNFGKRL